MLNELSLSKKQKLYYEEAYIMIERIVSCKSTIKKEVYSKKYPTDFYNLVERVCNNYNIYDLIAQEANIYEEKLSVIIVAEILDNKIKNRKYEKIIFELAKDKVFKKNIKNLFCRCFKENKFDFKKTVIRDVYEIYEDFDKKNKDFRENYILQNFSSAIPAFILNPKINSTVVDCCAAPGNKTTQLSFIMKNTGKIFAYERNKIRFNILEKQVKNLKAKNVKIFHSDFLKIKPKKVDYVLLDPPCSGSGIHEFHEKDNERLTKLHNLQVVLFKHALKFNPNKIVYSTCSVYVEEGEEVIKEVLKNSSYKVESIYLEGTKSGVEGYDFSDKVIRVEKNNKYHGFFICLLTKI